MAENLFDIMDLSLLSRTQLRQLCKALYTLLQERKVEVQVNMVPALVPFTFNPNVIPPINPPYPFYGTICETPLKSLGQINSNTQSAAVKNTLIYNADAEVSF